MSSFSAYTFQREKGQLASAWLNFDGRGAGTSRAVRDTFNVSSVTDLGKGQYRITFLEPMVHPGYSIAASCSRHYGSDGTSLVSDVAVVTIETFTADYFDIICSSVSQAYTAKFDPEFVTICVFGD
jgi:hypothetical protein